MQKRDQNTDRGQAIGEQCELHKIKNIPESRIKIRAAWTLDKDLLMLDKRAESEYLESFNTVSCDLVKCGAGVHSLEV